MKEQIKTRKLEVSHEEIANLSDAQFKTLVIRYGVGDTVVSIAAFQNTGNQDQDAHRNGGVWSQNRGKSEGYEK